MRDFDNGDDKIDEQLSYIWNGSDRDVIPLVYAQVNGTLVYKDELNEKSYEQIYNIIGSRQKEEFVEFPRDYYYLQTDSESSQFPNISDLGSKGIRLTDLKPFQLDLDTDDVQRGEKTGHLLFFVKGKDPFEVNDTILMPIVRDYKSNCI
jgi:hypothetical protein